MYADTVTDSMQRAIDETNRRREIQIKYNEEHGITPQSIKKAVHDVIEISSKAKPGRSDMSDAEREEKIRLITEQMKQAAMELEFEQAAKLRDELFKLQGKDPEGAPRLAPGTIGSKKKARQRTRK